MKKFLFFILPLFICIFSISISATDFKTLFQKGIEQYKEENYEEALELFKKAYKLNSQHSPLCYFIGLTYRNMELYKDSISYLEKAITLKPKIKDAIPELIDSYYQIQNYNKALELIKFAESKNFFPDRIAFLKGLVLFKTNNLDNAIKSFEKAKKLNPTLKQSADFQIAAIYIKKNRKKEAIEKLKAVIIANPQSDIAVFSRDYINLLKKRLAVEKIWHFNVSMMFKYDSNVILKPSSTIPGIEISDKDDYGMTSTASIGFTAPFSYRTPYILNIRYSFYSDNYFSIQTHDVTGHSITVTPGYNFKRVSFSIPVSYSYTWVHEKEYSEQISISPVIRFLLNSNNFVELGGGYKKNNYFSKTISKESDRDSDYYFGYLGYIYLFKKQKGMLNLKVTTAKDDTDGDYWKTNNYIFSANLLYPILDKLQFQAGFSYEKDNYDKSQPSIGSTPGTYRKRVDKIYSPTAGLTYNISKSFDIVLQYQFTRSDSNIPIFDYKRYMIVTGIEFRW